LLALLFIQERAPKRPFYLKSANNSGSDIYILFISIIIRQEKFPVLCAGAPALPLLSYSIGALLPLL
jgi:hypothetical protein